MNARRFAWIALTLSASACTAGPPETCKPGTFGCECREDESACDAGLACIDELCVPELDGAGGGGSDPGARTMGGDSASGGATADPNEPSMAGADAGGDPSGDAGADGSAGATDGAGGTSGAGGTAGSAQEPEPQGGSAGSGGAGGTTPGGAAGTNAGTGGAPVFPGACRSCAVEACAGFRGACQQDAVCAGCASGDFTTSACASNAAFAAYKACFCTGFCAPSCVDVCD